MQKITGDLNEIGTWWTASAQSVMEGYVEFIKIGDTRYRKVGCAADFHDFLSGHLGMPVTIYIHRWLGITKIIVGVKDEETGDKMAFHMPSLVVLLLKTFVALAIIWLILVVAFVSIFMPHSTMEFMTMLYLALLISGAIIFFQGRAFIQAKAAL